MSDVKLILRLRMCQKTNVPFFSHQESGRSTITRLPARIPQVSTFLSVLFLAKEMNSSSKEAGKTTVLNPDGPRNIVRGLRLRSNPGTSL